jgi:nucleoside-diphosphate-sugar epimerase
VQYSRECGYLWSIMRIFLAGASGLIGIRLIPLLVQAGHTVAGMTRSAAKIAAIHDAGAEPVVCDVYDAARLTEVVRNFAPDLVMHQLTDLPDDARSIPDFAARNARIRREGTRNLLAAARAANALRVVAQSVAWMIPGDGGAAVAEHERAVLAYPGVVIRYGRFYGPGTYAAHELPEPPRIHIDEAARRTLEHLTAPAGVVIVAE